MAIQTIDDATYQRDIVTIAKGKGDNAMKGKVEQYQTINSPPDTIFAYVGVGKLNGMGCDRLLGQTYPITTFMGDVLGHATLGSTWRVNSYMGSHIGQYYARIAGREYTGRGFGSGMYIRLRETADSKRTRGAM